MEIIYSIINLAIKIMKHYQNIGAIDRLIRVLLGEICLLIGYFLFDQIPQIALYFISLGLFLTAILGFSTVYKISGLSTIVEKEMPLTKLIKKTLLTLIIITPIVAIYFSSIG